MFLRIYANCQDGEATTLASAIESALALYDPVSAARPRPYWKMPELFEFTYRLSSPTRDIWEELVTESPGVWKVLDDAEERSSIWNRTDDRLFLAPAVRWAGLATEG